MGWRRRKGRLGWYTRAVLLLHRVVCVVEKDVAPPDPCSGARLERVTYRIHNLNASVRVTNSVTSPALEGRVRSCVHLDYSLFLSEMERERVPIPGTRLETFAIQIDRKREFGHI